MKIGKIKQLTFTPGLKQVVRFLQMMTLGDDSVIMSTYLQSKCLYKSRQKYFNKKTILLIMYILIVLK
jgi:hypothetical protein